MSHVSPQYDVIIAETGASPVFFKTQNGTEYFAYESIYAIGEARSTYYKAKKPIETWSANITNLKKTLQRKKTDFHQRKPPHPTTYSNPLFSFMLFISSGDFEPEDLSDFYKNTPHGDLPNAVCFLDRCVILNIQSGRNAEGGLVPIFMNPHPEFAIESKDREQHWSFISFGPRRLSGRMQSGHTFLHAALASNLLQINISKYDYIFNANAQGFSWSSILIECVTEVMIAVLIRETHTNDCHSRR